MDETSEYVGPPVGSFGWAIGYLQAGHKVMRRGWNGKGQWVKLQTPDSNSKMTAPYMYLHNAQGQLIPWTPSQGDTFADDWEQLG